MNIDLKDQLKKVNRVSSKEVIKNKYKEEIKRIKAYQNEEVVKIIKVR